MKKIIISLLFLLSVKVIFASCTSGGLQFYPEQKEISMNSMFIIEGYANSQNLIIEFHKKKVFLVSENGELIELKLERIRRGQKKLMQAIFKPAKELKSNTIYYLKYNDDSIGFYTQWNSDKKQHEKVHWVTSDLKNCKPINPNLKIEFQKTEVKEYGCGNSVNAIFSIKNNTDIEVWYKTEVVNLTNNRNNTYYIKEWKGKLNVGHGMCAGAFSFDLSSRYKVRFTPMNTDGRTLNTTDWIEFENPNSNTK